MDDLFRRLQVGDVVDGTVAGLAGYGALVQMSDAPDDDLFGDGLIHMSELAPDRVSRVTGVVRLGQRVRVIGLEPEQNRIPAQPARRAVCLTGSGRA